MPSAHGDDLMTGVASTTVHLTLLGRFAVTIDGAERSLGHPCRRLLGLLGIRGELGFSRMQAAALLWPDDTQEHAAKHLRTCLYRLGDVSKRLVERTDRELSVASGAVVDYLVATKRGRALCARQDRFAELDTTPFEHELLPDWDEDWVLVERESFRQLRFAALEAIAERYIESGRNDAAIQACLLVTRVDPLRESAHRIIARAHAREGNPAQALRQLNAYAETLGREIGMPPSALVVDLRRQLMARPGE